LNSIPRLLHLTQVHDITTECEYQISSTATIESLRYKINTNERISDNVYKLTAMLSLLISNSYQPKLISKLRLGDGIHEEEHQPTLAEIAAALLYDDFPRKGIDYPTIAPNVVGKFVPFVYLQKLRCDEFEMDDVEDFMWKELGIEKGETFEARIFGPVRWEDTPATSGLQLVSDGVYFADEFFNASYRWFYEEKQLIVFHLPKRREMRVLKMMRYFFFGISLFVLRSYSSDLVRRFKDVDRVNRIMRILCTLLRFSLLFCFIL